MLSSPYPGRCPGLGGLAPAGHLCARSNRRDTCIELWSKNDYIVTIFSCFSVLRRKGRYAQNHSKIDSKSFKQTVVDFRNDFLLILRPRADQGRFSSLFGVLGVFGNIKSRCRCSFSLSFLLRESGRNDFGEVIISETPGPLTWG